MHHFSRLSGGIVACGHDVVLSTVAENLWDQVHRHELHHLLITVQA